MGPLGLSIAGPAIGAGISAIGSIFSGKSAQDNAMYNYKHRYRWQVNDMKKAGINPMLAFSQAAPNVPQAQIPDLGEAVVRGAGAGGQVSAQRAMLAAQQENLKADTELKGTQSAANIANARATSISSGIAEPQLAYSSVNAERQKEKLEMEVQLLGKQAEKLDVDIKLADQQFLQQAQLQPLLVKHQELMNRVKNAELPALEAEAAFWDALPEAAWVKKLRDILPSFPKGISSAKGAAKPNTHTPYVRKR